MHHSAAMWIAPALLEQARKLRQSQTPAEDILWHCLRDSRLDGLKFRRQHPLGPFVVDFYCHAARLTIELDGVSHEYRAQRDRERSLWLSDRGYRELRFKNRDIYDGLEQALKIISRAARSSDRPSPGPSGHPLPGGEGL